MPWMVIVALFVVLVPGCKKDPEPKDGTASPGRQLAPPPPPRHPVHAQVPEVVIDAGPRIDASTDYSCASARDCVVSCDIPGSCCSEPCECTRAYHKNELEAVRKRNEERCANKDVACVQADCPRPDEDYVPRCRKEACVAEKVPRYWPPSQPYRCAKDSDCVVSCSRPNQRCPDLCNCTSVYHKDELAEISRINNARYPEDEQATCPVAKCAKPLYSTAAVCQAGRCVGKRIPN